MKDYFRKNKAVHFDFPIDGDCVTSADGVRAGKDLLVKVKVSASKDAEIEVNDLPTRWNGTHHEAEILFSAYRTSLTAVDKKSGESDVIAVFKLHDPEKKFRLSSDDNILFLRDITKNQEKYQSIFENEYLKLYKRAHDETGVCVHLNLFFETKGKEGDPDYFNLTMMPDKYKKEFEANSDWLRLSFHARADEPFWPYKNASYQQVKGDCDLVNEQIIRFAGEKTLGKESTLHFGAATVSGVRAMRNGGYQTLAGYFEIDHKGEPLVAYHYPKDLVEYVGERDFWRDTEEDITYCRIDRVLNRDKTVEANLAAIKKAMEVPTRAPFMEIMIHEQYFHKEIELLYIPAFSDIVLESCRYIKERGYKGSFLHSVVSEN